MRMQNRVEGSGGGTFTLPFMHAFLVNVLIVCCLVFFVMLLSFEIPSSPAVSLCFKYQSYRLSTAQ